jgi:MSHA biogenesis protein MshE
MAQPPKRIRLGDMLVHSGAITDDQLVQALQEQKKTGLKLGRALIHLNFIKEEQLLNILSEQLHIPFVDIKKYTFNEELVRRLPETFARRFRSIILKQLNGSVLVGMSDPMDISAYDEISRVLASPVDLAVVREADLLAALDRIYRRSSEISSLAEELHEELGDEQIDLSKLLETGDATEAPVVKLLHSIFEDAIQIKASDIHIEPDEHLLRIRQRVDGVLQEQVMKEKRIAPALVLRLKLMSGLDISEKRLPQDGRFHVRVKQHEVDVRLSTIPTQHGESVVMRLLDQSNNAIDLEHCGMPAAMLRRFRRLIHRPHGLILVTGPTGSGKTTTLYGALSELNVPEKKIITVEDPVEYQLERISQVQVNPKINLTFGSVLRASLRQDPDILLVGEIRDTETAQISLRAAMTGHLVLSTLHTNDAVTSAMRLIDIGAEGYLVASSLRVVVAQRLVRRICDVCKTSYTPDTQETVFLQSVINSDATDHFQFKKGAGCQQCNQTGYKGRIGIFELLEIDEPMADALRRNDTSAFTKAAFASPHFKPLIHSALEYAEQGIISLDEVLRIAEQLDSSEENVITGVSEPAT